MTVEQAMLFAALVGGISSLVGAGIGSLVSYKAAKMQFLSSVVYASRQKWGDDLRDVLARFLSAVTDLAVINSDQEIWADRLSAANALRFEIQLLLSLDDVEHKVLIETVEDLVAVASNADRLEAGELPLAHGLFVAAARRVLKEAWETATEPISAV